MYSAYNSCLVFNGEFYGYKNVKQQLSYPFKTTSDTEVILALYHQYGAENFIQKVRGMFSFALWDEGTQTFVAARDRFGEKPFYYALTNEGAIVFASELKSILSSGLIKPEIDEAALTHYLKHLYVHPWHTIYKNVHVLPPAHYLVYKDGKHHIKRYWDLPQQQLNITFEEAKEECYRLLNKAIQEQLVADVKVGAFLSGGLDSSTITALAAMNSEKQLTTISFSFGSEGNELPYSRQISKKYNTNNIELHHDDFDIAHWFEKMNEIYDEPFADSSNIPTYLISKAAAKELKVVLTGDGGDELFAGYSNWYPQLLTMQQQGFSGFLKKFKKKLLHSKYRSNSIAEIHVQQNEYFSDDELNSICSYKAEYNFDKFLNQPHNTVDAAMRMDLQDYMPADILVKTDRAAMANSLELRAPFLDVDFAEFCIALPESFKIDEHTDKKLMRASFKHLWTDDILTRKKQGFGAPVNKWLQQKGMKELKHTFLDDANSSLYKYINYNSAKAVTAKDNYQIWILLNLAVWLHKHKL
jgi:asparagine synthase (glutamine-hydrolysing)